MVAPLVVYGGDTQKEGGSESYFATTLRNVTVDGWVVIAILAVMFFAAMLIMAAKTFYLKRVSRGNARFMTEFRKMSDDPSALEKRLGGSSAEADEEESAFEQGTQSQLVSALSTDGTGFGISTLWRLYHHGMRETMKRLEGQPAGAARVQTLSSQSIEAIRATLDASLTRMTQQLSSQMVWLTIAIAGGPFLGLLGTVVGVMITFAAIAASGDVNVNAIAPGIAAALVATVAGLGVAIPCLFGYNYLNTRVKEIGADMRVFVDEFVARIAETYS
jgi:biopolymer transport protein ExbB